MTYLIVSFSSAFVALLIGFVIGHRFGYEAGEQSGRAIEWCENYFAKAKKERARRDAQGRFKS